jgi:hypothetical protein
MHDSGDHFADRMRVEAEIRKGAGIRLGGEPSAKYVDSPEEKHTEQPSGSQPSFVRETFD